MQVCDCKEEVKLAEDGDMQIDKGVVVDLRIGVWDFTLKVVHLVLDVLVCEATLASDACMIKAFFRGGGGQDCMIHCDLRQLP